MDSLIPASQISNLTQGTFVAAVADNFAERIEQKIIHCEIVVDNEKVKRETCLLYTSLEIRCKKREKKRPLKTLSRFVLRCPDLSTNHLFYSIINHRYFAADVYKRQSQHTAEQVRHG